MTAVQVRLASVEDIPIISAFWHEKAVMLAQQDQRWRLRADARADWEAAAARWLSTAHTALMVAVDNQSPIGYLMVQIQPAPPGWLPDAVGYIHDLALDLHRYYPGAASALVEAARAWCQQSGVTQCAVMAAQRAVIDQAFWRAQGASDWMGWLWLRS